MKIIWICSPRKIMYVWCYKMPRIFSFFWFWISRCSLGIGNGTPWKTFYANVGCLGCFVCFLFNATGLWPLKHAWYGWLSCGFFSGPINIWTFNTERLEISLGRSGAHSIDKRMLNLELLNKVEKPSLDYYAAIHSLHRRRRGNDISNDIVKTQP